MVAFDPHGMLICLYVLKWVINGEIIINSAYMYMYLVNVLPKRFRLSASSEAYNKKMRTLS